MKRNLTILAGREALKRLSADGIQSQDVGTIAGAAGGPKWLALSQIDRALFGDWLKPRSTPLFLVGSSIGAWRFAAATQKDPKQAIERFEKAYFQQQYAKNPPPSEVSRVSYEVLDAYLGKDSIEELLKHPYFRLSILTVKCKHLLVSDSKPLLLAGVAIAAASNVLHPQLLRASFRREVFSDPRDLAPFLKNRKFPALSYALTEENFRKALMASGSIPGVMSRVSDLHVNQKAAHRDGGMMDYHLDLPYSEDKTDNRYVLFPHYTDQIVPNWFDKYLKWRKPSQSNLKNLILICPSREFIQKLPLGKIPDRNDFLLFKGRDLERIKYWTQVLKECERLRDEFLEIFEGNRVAEFASPLGSMR